MPVIKNVRGGTVGWNEEDRLLLANILVKAGYTVRIDHQPVSGATNNKKEYVVIYEEPEKKK